MVAENGASRARVRHQLSIDLEPAPVAGNLRTAFQQPGNAMLKAELEERVLLSTRGVLRLLERRGLRACFFVLGTVAEKHPGLIDEIAAAGHRIAAHGLSHARLLELGEEGFRRELACCRSLLAPWEAAWEHSHGPGFRAPDFSLPVTHDWPYRVLAEEGFGWSSSVMVARVARRSLRKLDADVSQAIHQSRPHMRVTGDRGIWEYPLQGFRLGPLPLSWGGGFWLRALSLRWNLYHMRRWNQAGRSFHLYFHPWELDADQPRLQLPLLRGLRQYKGLSGFEARLEKVLQEFVWRPAGPE